VLFGGSNLSSSPPGRNDKSTFDSYGLRHTERDLDTHTRCTQRDLDTHTRHTHRD
jgi:hypothetical protein